MVGDGEGRGSWRRLECSPCHLPVPSLPRCERRAPGCPTQRNCASGKRSLADHSSIAFPPRRNSIPQAASRSAPPPCCSRSPPPAFLAYKAVLVRDSRVRKVWLSSTVSLRCATACSPLPTADESCVERKSSRATRSKAGGVKAVGFLVGRG
jgi:hypothetical protein